MFDVIKQLFTLLFSFKMTETSDGKPAWRSKTIWVNLVTLLAVVLSKYADINLSTEDIAAILAIINIILRLVTKSSTGFYETSK